MQGFGNKKKSKKKEIYHLKNNKDYYQILNQAIKYQTAGNIVQAIQYYEFLIKKGLQESAVFTNYGIILINLGRFKEAVFSIRKAIKLNPRDATLHSNLGGILKNLGRLEEAELSIRKAIELNPNFVDAYSNLGVILKDLGRLQEAELSIRKAIELNPNFVDAYSNLGVILKDLGKLQEAELSIRKAIELNPNFVDAYSNLGVILKDLGKLEEAERLYRKAIEVNPNFADAYSNLGNLLKDLGKLEEAELSIRKAIEINPKLAKAYYVLSTFDMPLNEKDWAKYLFTEDILKKQNDIESIDIYFARANILEKKLNYKQSSKMFMKANKLVRKIYGSNYVDEKDQMQYFYEIWQNIKKKQVRQKNELTSIFIVGLPRSGKTLTESILSCNKSLLQCGENSAMSIAVDQYLNRKEITNNQDLYQLYIENISMDLTNKLYICSTTPSNYKLTGIIASQIVNSKIIYCFRNPLDHLKELYCRNLTNKFTFKTSIIESTKILLSINELMEFYRKIYHSKIYFLNYDELVLHPEKEIKSLVNWLGLEYKEEYLYPQLDPTTSINSDKNNGVINTKYLNVWKDYEKLLAPAIEIISSNNKYLI